MSTRKDYWNSVSEMAEREETAEEEEFKKFVKLQTQKKVVTDNMLSGSLAELPMKYVISNVSDMDHLIINYDIFALPYLPPIPKKLIGSVFRIDTKDVRPGFARLRHATTGVCLNRESVFKRQNQSGPADTSQFITSEELTEISLKMAFDSKHAFKQYTVDYVYAIHCPIWPNEADEWITRKRVCEWPTGELIQRIVGGGCHFVCKPQPNAPNDTSTFRFSFSFAETLLVRSWSDRQKYFYHILRLVKNELTQQMTKENHETVICTYTMKTLMLWACENKSPDFWNNRSDESVICELLCRLRGWLAKRKCQNYFIKCNNMFDHFDENELNFAVELVDAVLVNENQIEKMISFGKKINDVTHISILVPHQLILLLQLGIKRDTNFSEQRDEQSAMDRIFDNGEEFRNLLKAISTQRLIAELRNGFPSESGALNRLKTVADEKLRYAMAEFSQGSSEVTINVSLSSLQNILTIINKMQILARRRLKVCIYSRDKITNIHEGVNRNTMHHQSENLPLELITNTFLQAVINFFPKATYFLSAAYRCNYYFSCLEDYPQCLSLCDEAFGRFKETNKTAALSGNYSSNLCSVIITREWCSIFDKFVQISFGFLVLHEYLAKNALKTPSRDLVVYTDPMKFMNYVENQISVRLSNILSRRQQEREQFRQCCKLLLSSIALEKDVLKGIWDLKILQNVGRKAASEKLKSLSCVL